MFMKKSVLFFALGMGVLLSSCDKVEQPFINPPIDPTTCPAPTFPANTNAIRHVLIEEFTGHACNNCPGGARELNKILKPIYEDSMIVVSIHAGALAAPDYYGNGTTYLEDFTNANSEELFNYSGFDLLLAGYPVALINRYPVFGFPYAYKPSWSNAIADELAKPLEINLQMIVEETPSTGGYCVHVESEFLTAMSGDFKVGVYVMEDSLVGYQLNASGSNGDTDYPTGDVPNYLHRHVLRKALNGTWGATALTGSAAAGDKFVNSFYFQPDPSWDLDHITLVAFIYDFSTTTRVVHQSIEEHLIH